MKNDFFESIEADELQKISGGSISLGAIVLSAIAGTVITLAVDVGNEALKNQTGRDIPEWATYHVGNVVNKIGQGLEELGNILQ